MCIRDSLSPKQLGQVLFVDLGLPPAKRTKTGFSTDAEVLENLAPAHPVVEKILLYRQMTKLKGTYLDGLLAVADPDTRRVHSLFHQAVTATGRISSSEPNLQNIPVRTDMGREIRKAFVAGPGNLLVDADYSQIELRVLCLLYTSQGKEAARIAVTMLNAPQCPAGIMPVVIDNGFGGVIFHEACGHSLEATSVGRGNSVFCGKLGQKIASDVVTAVDDGTQMCIRDRYRCPRAGSAASRYRGPGV